MKNTYTIEVISTLKENGQKKDHYKLMSRLFSRLKS